MAKREKSDSESESEDEEKLSSEEGAGDSGSDGEEQKPEISEYEKQRLARIAENRARMVALGLPNMASSLMGSSQNSTQNSRTHKGKRKAAEDDEDYRPNHDDGDDEEEELDNDDQDDDDEEFFGNNASRSRKSKLKNKGTKSNKKVSTANNFSWSDFVDDDNDLMKAIALSLQESSQGSCVILKDAEDATFGERKGNTRMKKKKSFASRVQMNEDEMIMYFFMFDEAGKGGIPVRDLQRVAVAHDFMWTDKELADMIHCFDSSGVGKLTLEDFRKIVSRCNMLQPS